jgi:hypothetical protein
MTSNWSYVRNQSCLSESFLCSFLDSCSLYWYLNFLHSVIIAEQHKWAGVWFLKLFGPNATLPGVCEKPQADLGVKLKCLNLDAVGLFHSCNMCKNRCVVSKGLICGFWDCSSWVTDFKQWHLSLVWLITGYKLRKGGIWEGWCFIIHESKFPLLFAWRDESLVFN